MDNIERKALEAIIKLTDGYDQYGMTIAWACNVIAKKALNIDVSDILCNHEDEVFRPNTCPACQKMLERGLE